MHLGVRRIYAYAQFENVQVVQHYKLLFIYMHYIS